MAINGQINLGNGHTSPYIYTCKANVKKMDTMTPRRRKSEKLTPEEIKAFKNYRKGFDTDVDCAESIGISREVMIRVGILGSGSPETIEKIRAVITV